MDRLVIFDVDGTLVESVKIDTACFTKSITGEFGIFDINEDWSSYESATDRAIFEQIYRTRFNIDPSPADIERHIRRFVALLDECARTGEAIREIPGAGDIVTALKRDPRWRVGIATGCWMESAVFKLNKAKIDIGNIPLSTSSGNKYREEIVSSCIESSKRHYGAMNFDKIVYVGDAPWDLKTAGNLGIGFIGIDGNDAFEGARCRAVNGYEDRDLFMRYLEEA